MESVITNHAYVQEFYMFLICYNNICVDEIFRTRPYRTRSSPSPLYNGYWVCFLRAKRPERGTNNTLSSAEVKERVEI
jgi:hypothetical protein